MIALFLVATLFATLLILPGWIWLGRTRPQTFWLLALPFCGVTLWVALNALGVGAQSLANLSELFWVAVSAVVVSYLKLFVLDRSPALRGKGTAIAFLFVGLVATGLRLFMPALPE
ncbi:hypothetical protein [Dyella caseinilytica]|uniref:Uncharacterized protein n=1 Tax=Dyella caseinilytica TaxID=1849581 RepID=A0ABX7GUN9_9GAMM|nr:hypothetical protein [Dyella caseinilytica]QRN53673.1 hypothetical protein ISN74_20115 [Dyella caseinilytica]GFZ88393.1 hypothetical protein GCM10011408_03830 [Dyella caseinilytica]